MATLRLWAHWAHWGYSDFDYIGTLGTLGILETFKLWPHCTMGLSNSKDPLKKIYPKKIKGKNICILQGWMGLVFLDQIENLLQISPVPYRSHFFNFLFQILNPPNCPDSTMYDTLYFDVSD